MNTLTSKLQVLAKSVLRLYKSTIQKVFKGNEGHEEDAELLKVYQENDSAKNLETTPPDDERIDLPCMWAVEFYTPSQVDKLLEKLERLGWDKNEGLSRESPASWLRSSRQRSLGGSWMNLGIIRSNDDTRTWPLKNRTAPMPKHVSYATGGLHTITPSLTCIAIRFTFDENFRCRFQNTLRQSRKTITRPTDRGYEILDPWSQKSNEIREIRTKCKEIAATWFRENIPGVFSSGILGNQLPTYELVTLHKAEPFPDQDGEGYPPPKYLMILDLASSTSVWRDKEVPSLKFSWGLQGRSPEFHSVFVARDAEIEGTKKLEAYGGVTGLPGYIDIAFNQMIGKLDLAHLLEGYSRRLNKLRDSVTERIRRPSRRSPIHTLEELLGNVAYDVDIAAVTTDLISTTREPSWLDRSLKTFERCNNWAPQIPLSEIFRSAINRHAMGLKQTDKSLRDHLTQFGSLIAATEDVRMQKRILWLTVVVAAVAIATLLTADVDSPLLRLIQNIWIRLGL